MFNFWNRQKNTLEALPALGAATDGTTRPMPIIQGFAPVPSEQQRYHEGQDVRFAGASALGTSTISTASTYPTASIAQDRGFFNNRSPRSNGKVVAAKKIPAPIVPIETFNMMIKASRDWRCYDVQRILEGIGIKHTRCEHANKPTTVRKVLDTYHKYAYTESICITWQGGPNMVTTYNTNISHWMLDKIMEHLRIKEVSVGEVVKLL